MCMVCILLVVFDRIHFTGHLQRKWNLKITANTSKLIVLQVRHRISLFFFHFAGPLLKMKECFALLLSHKRMCAWRMFPAIGKNFWSDMPNLLSTKWRKTNSLNRLQRNLDASFFYADVVTVSVTQCVQGIFLILIFGDSLYNHISVAISLCPCWHFYCWEKQN